MALLFRCSNKAWSIARQAMSAQAPWIGRLQVGVQADFRASIRTHIILTTFKKCIEEGEKLCLFR